MRIDRMESMRVFAAILCLLVALSVFASGVAAVAMQVPQDLNGIDIEEDDNPHSFSFVMVGDDVDRQVEFFMIPEFDGYVTFDGEPQFSQEYQLPAYEEVRVTVEDVEVIAEYNDLEFRYGFLYGDAGTVNDGVGFENVVSATFEADIEGPPLDADEDETSETTADTQDDSVSGGGGGALLPPQKQRDAGVEDVSPQSSATTTGVVEEDEDDGLVFDSSPNSNTQTVTDVQETLRQATAPKGKPVAIVLLGLLGMMLVLNMVLIQRYKREE